MTHATHVTVMAVEPLPSAFEFGRQVSVRMRVILDGDIPLDFFIYLPQDAKISYGDKHYCSALDIKVGDELPFTANDLHAWQKYGITRMSFEATVEP